MTGQASPVRLKRHYSIVAHSVDVAELRCGVWNPVSFTLTDQSGSGHLVKILKRLDGRLSVAEIAAAEGVPTAEVEAVLARLADLELLETHSTHALDYYLDQVASTLFAHERQSDEAASLVVLVGDSEISADISRMLGSDTLGAPFRIVTDEAARELLLECGQSWLFDSLAFEEGVRSFAHWRGKLIVCGVRTVHPIELRAVNRISLHYRIPWIHAAVDGPFLLIGPTFVPFRSACYECLEARLVMNMRESASYQRYKNALADGRVSGTGVPLNAVLRGIVSSLVAFEVLNFSLTGTSFTVGKMLSIYLPTLEFTFHDVLRLPGCPACSPAPERDDKELYFDVRALL